MVQKAIKFVRILKTSKLNEDGQSCWMYTCKLPFNETLSLIKNESFGPCVEAARIIIQLARTSTDINKIFLIQTRLLASIFFVCDIYNLAFWQENGCRLQRLHEVKPT